MPPHSPPTVPSSTRVTRGLATIWPIWADIDRGVFHDVVGLKPVPACLVEQDPAAAAGQHDGKLARGGGPGAELGQRPVPAATLADLVDIDAFEHLETLVRARDS